MGFFNREAKKINRFRVGKGSPGIRASMYRLTNKTYLDIRIYRGYRLLTRIVTRDTGMSRFTVENVGTFIVPKGDKLLKQYHDRHAVYLNYNKDTSAAGEPVEETEATTFNYPAITPEEFQIHLEAQTVADLLSETAPNMTWIWYLVGAAVLIFALLMVFGGGA